MYIVVQVISLFGIRISNKNIPYIENQAIVAILKKAHVKIGVGNDSFANLCTSLHEVEYFLSRSICSK